MSFISYAQNYEDVILWRALKNIKQGFYIDVGANDPDQDSVTKLFYEHGWRGINIEPVTQWFDRLESERIRDVNLKVAVGNAARVMTLYELPDTGLSTMDLATAERHEKERGYQKIERQVTVETLTDICQKYHEKPIHFLKIDVEGAEKAALEGMDLKLIRPWVIVVESTLPNTQVEDYEFWESELLEAQYIFVYFDGLNRFYIADEHKELAIHFQAPPNVFDEFITKSQFDSEVRVVRLETDLSETESTTDQLERELSQAGAAKGQLEAELSQIGAVRDQLQTELSQAGSTKDQLEAELSQVGAAKDQLETELSQVGGAKNQLETELSQVGVAKNQLETELSQAGVAKNQLETELSQSKAQIVLLGEEGQLAKEEIDNANQSIYHVNMAVNRLDEELKSVYASKSWRIMLRLRQIMHAIKRLLLLPVSILRGRTLPPKVMIHNFMAKLIQYISQSPLIRVPLVGILNRFPGIKIKLIALININGLRSVIATQEEKTVQDIADEQINESVVNERQVTLPTVPDGINNKMKSPLEKWFY